MAGGQTDTGGEAVNREQQLIDYCFEFAIRVHADPTKFKDREEIAQWIRYNLGELGFPVHPVGMSHGVLDKGAL